MMTPAFAILAVLTIGSAVFAMGLRNLVHCALALVGTFVGLAGLYLQLDAQFVGFAQILVYVGAVAILIVFAILLTRSPDTSGGRQSIVSAPWVFGLGVASLVFATVSGCIIGSSFSMPTTPPAPDATVRQIGDALMTKYVLPLEIVGLLLTAALIGAVIIAMHERNPEAAEARPESRAGSAGSDPLAHPPAAPHNLP